MRGAYYNEIDPYAAQWLRNLIAAGHIAAGDVDERSIVDVLPGDLRGYTQCHFFAGIGGWSYALRLAGFTDDRPVWTGSCPCQPFSAAGKQRGSEDARHLWPTFFDLIRECRPGIVFGEQVAGAAGLAWWDHVAADLESAGYAAAAANLGAHSVGAPHIRQRLYWVANAERRVAERLGYDLGEEATGSEEEVQEWQRLRDESRPSGDADEVAHPYAPGRGGQRRGGLFDSQQSAQRDNADRCGTDGRLGDTGCSGSSQQRRRWNEPSGLATAGAANRLGNAPGARSQGRDEPGQRLDAQRTAAERAGPLDLWAELEWIECSDGKARPAKPGIFPLAHGVSNRVGRLRAYGNAIVPQVGAAFVEAVMGCRP